jgi:hypothetical protein
MFRHWRPKETILPLLLGDHFPHSIAVAGMLPSNQAEEGLFFDPYWGESFQCWASFDEQTAVKDQTWNMLCVYTKPEDVHWNGNVDIRFYTSLERRINQRYQLRDEDLTYVQDWLRSWTTSYVDEFKDVLPQNFGLLFGSFHISLEQAARKAFNIPETVSFFPWLKFLIPVNPLLESPAFRDDVYIDTIRPQHFDLILTSSSIPRTRHYLQTRISSSTALYRNSNINTPPIAFCVNAADRSLSTLWVDPAFRNRGLGKMVTRERLLGPGGMIPCPSHTTGSELEKGWSHADIAADNAGSRRLCEGLRGKETWKVIWIWIRIEMRIPQLVGVHHFS